jgi:hypothetical protein
MTEYPSTISFGSVSFPSLPHQQSNMSSNHGNSNHGMYPILSFLSAQQQQHYELLFSTYKIPSFQGFIPGTYI